MYECEVWVQLLPILQEGATATPISEVTALELFAPKEDLEVAPEVVANVDVVMTLVAVQLQLLYVPSVHCRGDLSVRVVHVVAAHASKELPLRISVLPVTELVVLPVDEDGDDASAMPVKTKGL